MENHTNIFPKEITTIPISKKGKLRKAMTANILKGLSIKKITPHGLLFLSLANLEFSVNFQCWVTFQMLNLSLLIHETYSFSQMLDWDMTDSSQKWCLRLTDIWHPHQYVTAVAIIHEIIHDNHSTVPKMENTAGV